MHGGHVMTVERLSIIGIGLIGGSLAAALKQGRAPPRIVACDCDHNTLEKARRLGLTDAGHTEPEHAVAGSQLVVLAVPPSAMPGVLRSLATRLPADCILTDVASVKGQVVELAARSLGEAVARFVPGHPLAGTERSGIEAARADLFRGRRVILTPTPQTDLQALQEVRKLWEGLGAVVDEMEAAAHDRILAATSHLPHVLAYSLVRMVLEQEGQGSLLRHAASGFADTTRIAASDPCLWRDIFFANQSALLAAIDAFSARLAELRSVIEAGDDAETLALLRSAKQARDGLAAARGERA
ncbi:MAG: prephenate dehydrogenase [Gammaproteobacteria bacterium]